MRVPIELTTMDSIKHFSNLVKTVDCDVRLTGKDENGCDWNLSAKSLYGSIILTSALQKKRKHTAHEVDWNTIYCECEIDIYELIKDYVKTE